MIDCTNKIDIIVFDLSLTQEVAVVEGPIIIIVVPPAVIVSTSEVVSADRSAILAISSELAVIGSTRVVAHSITRVRTCVDTRLHSALRIGNDGSIIDNCIDTAAIRAISSFNTGGNSISVVGHVVVVVCVSVHFAIISSEVIVHVVAIVRVVIVVLAFCAVITNAIKGEFATVVTNDAFAVLDNVSDGDGLFVHDFTCAGVQTSDLKKTGKGKSTTTTTTTKSALLRENGTEHKHWSDNISQWFVPVEESSCFHLRP